MLERRKRDYQEITYSTVLLYICFTYTAPPTTEYMRTTETTGKHPGLALCHNTNISPGGKLDALTTYIIDSEYV